MSCFKESLMAHVRSADSNVALVRQTVALSRSRLMLPYAAVAATGDIQCTA
jgi:hypothetical protein